MGMNISGPGISYIKCKIIDASLIYGSDYDIIFIGNIISRLQYPLSHLLQRAVSYEQGY